MTWIVAASLALLLLADWSQTVDVVAYKRELNPIIGKDGRRVRPGIYFPIVILASLAVVIFVPGEWVTDLGLLLIGSESQQVWANFSSGYRFRWWWDSSN